MNCSYCLIKFKRCDLDTHVLNDCLENEIECKICLNQSIKRKNMSDHLKDSCPENIIEC